MRSRALVVAFLAAALVVALPPTVSAQSDSDVKALSDKVNALEKRIADVERNLTQQLSRISQQLSQGGAPNAALETEAQTALGAVNRLISSGDTTKAKAEMTTFMQKYGSTRAAQGARRTYQELQIIGKAAPADWGIERWFQGENDIKLGNKGTTLVVFWETWCPHCQREVPKLQTLYNNLGKDGLSVVALTKVTKSSTEEKVEEFLKQQQVNYPVAKEDGSASMHFGVSGIPAAAVVKNGKVIWRGHPARLSEEQLKGWL